jgi:adiponectin receptor
MTFVVTGLSGFAPLGHGIQIFGLAQMMKQSGMPYYLAEGAILSLGALVYAVRQAFHKLGMVCH